MEKDYIVCVGGDESRAAFLIKGEKNILFDAGMAYSAGKMVERLERELQGRPLDAVLLSHSHYDHVSGLPFLRQRWPELVVYGSLHAKEILEKPSARKMMRELSEAAAKGAGLEALPAYEDEALRVDVVVRDREVLDFSAGAEAQMECCRNGEAEGASRSQAHKITVFETPGHTRCSLSFLVDDDVIFASETVGVTTRKVYMPCYLVGYQMALDAVEKLRNCGAKRIFITHVGILTEADRRTVLHGLGGRDFTPEAVWDYLEEELRRTKDEIVEIIKKYPAKEERLSEMLLRYHDGVGQGEQPDFAFLLNAAATLKVVERECMQSL